MSKKSGRTPTVSISIRFTEEQMAALDDAVEVKNHATPPSRRRTKTELVKLLALNWVTDVQHEIESKEEGGDPIRPFHGDQIRWTQL